jgi:hypothetical protein
MPVAVLVVDIDDFKRLNDTLGHLVGDACLVAVAEALRATLRATDEPFRYGARSSSSCCPGRRPTARLEPRSASGRRCGRPGRAASRSRSVPPSTGCTPARAAG